MDYDWLPLISNYIKSDWTVKLITRSWLAVMLVVVFGNQVFNGAELLWLLVTTLLLLLKFAWRVGHLPNGRDRFSVAIDQWIWIHAHWDKRGTKQISVVASTVEVGSVGRLVWQSLLLVWAEMVNHVKNEKIKIKIYCFKNKRLSYSKT